VHSPFVFALLTKCIYKKEKIDKKLKTLLTHQHPKEKQGIRSKKKQLILYKIASYFKSSEIFVLGKSKNTKELISLARPNSCVTVAEDFEMQFCEKEFDLVVIDTTNGIYNTVAFFEKILQSAHKNCVFIFEGIHSTKATTKAWQAIVDSKKTTVSIDGFYHGLVFLKKDQEKQHFTLRM